MSRLIDADKLIEVLNKNSIFRTVTNAEGKNAIEIIEEQPTSFDVDKVLKQLSEKIRAYYEAGLCNEENGKIKSALSRYDRAEGIEISYEIVREGGRDE